MVYSAFSHGCLTCYSAQTEKPAGYGLKSKKPRTTTNLPSFKCFHSCAYHSYENHVNTVTFGRSLGREMRKKALGVGSFLSSALIRHLALGSNFSFHLSRGRERETKTREGQVSLEVKILITFLQSSYLTK